MVYFLFETGDEVDSLKVGWGLWIMCCRPCSSGGWTSLHCLQPNQRGLKSAVEVYVLCGKVDEVDDLKVALGTGLSVVSHDHVMCRDGCIVYSQTTQAWTAQWTLLFENEGDGAIVSGR